MALGLLLKDLTNSRYSYNLLQIYILGEQISIVEREARRVVPAQVYSWKYKAKGKKVSTSWNITYLIICTLTDESLVSRTGSRIC